MRNEGHLRHSATEWPFVRPDARKWPFRARAVKALIVFHGKSAYFCSRFGAGDAKSEQKYADLPLKKISAFAPLRRNGHFGSGACPKPCILRCKTTFAFTTLARNGLFRSSWTENGHSAAERRRFFCERPFCTRASSLFRRVRTGRAANGHFRREVRRFFGQVAETIVKYTERGAPRGDLRTPGGRMGRLGRGKMYKRHAFLRDKTRFSAC